MLICSGVIERTRMISALGEQKRQENDRKMKEVMCTFWSSGIAARASGKTDVCEACAGG